MELHKIKFLPDETTVEVEDGTTLMKSAEEAGVHINNLCGEKACVEGAG